LHAKLQSLSEKARVGPISFFDTNGQKGIQTLPPDWSALDQLRWAAHLRWERSQPGAPISRRNS
jgi:hypothetical protein